MSSEFVSEVDRKFFGTGNPLSDEFSDLKGKLEYFLTTKSNWFWQPSRVWMVCYSVRLVYSTTFLVFLLVSHRGGMWVTVSTGNFFFYSIRVAICKAKRTQTWVQISILPVFHSGCWNLKLNKAGRAVTPTPATLSPLPAPISHRSIFFCRACIRFRNVKGSL